MITYAVVGRNEAPRLETALRQALDAAEPDDAVWFVDSASTDGSAAVARRLGVDVLRAPVGKGRAVATAVARCAGGLLCVIDGDIERSECNIPLALRDRWRETAAEMVIGLFVWEGRPLTITHFVHAPLVRGLFPEHARTLAPMPLSGFRFLDTSFPLGRLPSGYGLEAHLNVHVAATGGRIAWADLGVYHGPITRIPGMAVEIATAVLDVAQAVGRITASDRRGWERWLQPVLELIESPPASPGEASDYADRLAAAAARPSPTVRIER